MQKWRTLLIFFKILIEFNRLMVTLSSPNRLICFDFSTQHTQQHPSLLQTQDWNLFLLVDDVTICQIYRKTSHNKTKHQTLMFHQLYDPDDYALLSLIETAISTGLLNDE